MCEAGTKGARARRAVERWAWRTRVLLLSRDRGARRLPQRRGRARKCVSVASHGTAPAPRGAASSLHCAKGTWHACSERSPQPFFSVALPLPRSLDAPFTRTGQRMENFNFRNLYSRGRRPGRGGGGPVVSKDQALCLPLLCQPKCVPALWCLCSAHLHRVELADPASPSTLLAMTFTLFPFSVIYACSCHALFLSLCPISCLCCSFFLFHILLHTLFCSLPAAVPPKGGTGLVVRS